MELRTIMDWIFTDTALGLSSWLQLEDIYSNTYLLKCARWAEKVKQRGRRRRRIESCRNIQRLEEFLDRN